ncbi:MAG: hypothetical protein WBF93_08900 [Pirellulales bacterium]
MSANNASTASPTLPVVRLDQAVFTSARTRRSDGYQLVARSQGMSAEDQAALARWGPSHDSLIEDAERSINFFPLPSGAFCLSLTTAGGAEHSGRRGARHYTHCLVCSAADLAVVDNNPWALFAAAFRDDLFAVGDSVPESLPPVEIPIDAELTWPVCEIPASVPGAMPSNNCVIVGAVDREAVVAGVVAALPRDQRLTCSFATALRHSPRRPFRLMCLGEDPKLCRRLMRQGHQVFDQTVPV